MTTVTQLLDHLIKAAGDMGKPKDPIPSALIKARARIQHLEGQLAATETMRDRIAMQLLPGLMADYGLPNASTCVARAYQWADLVLAERAAEGSAGAPGETTSPENSETEHKPTEAMIEAACKVCIGFSGEGGTYNDYLCRDVAAEVLTAALSAR